MTVTPQELRNAAAYLREHGWMIGWRNSGWSHRTYTGPTCLIGSCAMGNGLAYMDLDSLNEWRRKCATAFAHAMGFKDEGSAIIWNDNPRRHQHEVLECIEAAACKLEQEETI